MRILISGATGLIGSVLVENLRRRNHDIHFLTLKEDELSIFGDKAKGFLWNPSLKAFDLAALEGVGAIIHLAGAPISKRWTESYKKEIIDSRVESTQLIHDVLLKHDNAVKQFISASAIGIYKDSLTIRHSENSPAIGNTFLADVVKKWERAADGFSHLKIKVCKIRTGLVLAKQGGALPQLDKPIRYGLGAPMGTGKQWQSWIHIDDLVGIYTFAAEQQLDGVYNAVAPNPVTSRELTKAIAKKLKRPLWLPGIPAFLLKMALGEMHTLLLESQLVESAKIDNAGYGFRFAQLESALEDIYK